MSLKKFKRESLKGKQEREAELSETKVVKKVKK